jgi:hypothetical protein
MFGFHIENFVVGWFQSIISLEENELVLPSGRIMFANKLQESGEGLQNIQRANRTGTGTVKTRISLGSGKLYAIRSLRGSQ